MSGLVAFLREARWLDAARSLAYARVLFVFMAAGLGYDLLSTMIGHHPGVAPEGRPGVPAATDFVAFWAAARLALEGHVAQAYDLGALSRLEHGVSVMDARALLAFFYPPTFLLACLPFGALPYLGGFAAFVAATGAVFVVGLRRILPRTWLRRNWTTLWGWLPALAFPGLLMNAATGQTGFLTATCFAWAAIWLETRPGLAGACLGMLVVKPHLALVVPVALLAARRWRALAACGATAAAWAGLSWAVLGNAAWTGFFASAPAIRDALENHPEDWGKLQSAFAAVRILGGGLEAAYAAQAALALAVLVLVAWVAWRRPGGAAEGACIAAAALCCTPHVLDYDLAAAGVPLAWLAAAAWRSGWLSWEKIAAGAAFLWPLFGRVATQPGHVPLAPVVMAGLLAVVARRALAEKEGVLF